MTFFLTLFLTFFLAYLLAFCLAFFLTCLLTFYLCKMWHDIQSFLQKPLRKLPYLPHTTLPQKQVHDNFVSIIHCSTSSTHCSNHSLKLLPNASDSPAISTQSQLSLMLGASHPARPLPLWLLPLCFIGGTKASCVPRCQMHQTAPPKKQLSPKMPWHQHKAAAKSHAGCEPSSPTLAIVALATLLHRWPGLSQHLIAIHVLQPAKRTPQCETQQHVDPTVGCRLLRQPHDLHTPHPFSLCALSAAPLNSYTVTQDHSNMVKITESAENHLICIAPLTLHSVQHYGHMYWHVTPWCKKAAKARDSNWPHIHDMHLLTASSDIRSCRDIKHTKHQ